MPRIHVPPADLASAPAAAEVPAADESANAVEETADGVAAVDADGQPKRKRSRRGSRGGKKRRKPAAASDTEDVVSADAETAVEVVADDEPPEYVPMSEWIDDFETRSRA